MINIKIDGENKKIEINDSEFVLKDDVEKLAMAKMKEILSVTCGYRDDIIDNIIKEHFKIDEIKEETTVKTGKSNKGRRSKFAKFEYNIDHHRPYKVARVEKNGKLYSKTREYSFNMDQLLYIKNSMSDDLTYWDISKISNKLKLSRDVVGRIMWNIEQGNFDDTIIEHQNLVYSKPKTVVENNPQKRKEMGFYGV